MIMGQARAVPVQVGYPGGSATIAVWNSATLPGGGAIAPAQLAVFTAQGASVAVPADGVAVSLGGSAAVTGAAASSPRAVLAGLLRMAVPYRDSGDRTVGPAGVREWVNAYRISQTGGLAVTATLPVLCGPVSAATVTVPAGGAVLVAGGGTAAANGLAAAATVGRVTVRLDDRGWGAATGVMDGKFEVVRGGVAQTSYPGWADLWPWSCRGNGSGCLRTVLATDRHGHGWMIAVSAANGYGLTMPDLGRVLAQLGAVSAMAFDANTHAALWRRGAAPVSSYGYEPRVPATTTLRYR
ncbi:MAG TPA: phosphodiester glycosidase family protein [Gaiellales bacterium]|nr:phosphodiester glycosidase family protein [Gaiellales bacterium]